MDSLTADAEALIRDLGAAPCHFAGLSMGGFIGMRLAIHRPELLKSLILMDTSADPEPEQNKGPYRRMAFIGRWFGFRPVIKPLTKIMFGQTFLNDPAARNHSRALEKPPDGPRQSGNQPGRARRHRPATAYTTCWAGSKPLP